ncbi:heparinase II/III-like protein [Mumia flava]|uniref:Heparinase II/III-like protein n=1 Tax=Mumia flava TaxID=1348852 RepID=A0A2M9BFY4_9ACTN|nr:alginate lyase family protein [Mumia flava]PJJ56867.1 heparinase II/III-like protein [Mumia flava]
MSRSLGWYAARLRRMSPTEVAGRVRDLGRRTAWRRRQVRPGDAAGTPAGLRPERSFASRLPDSARDDVDPGARAATLAAADAILEGRWDVLGTPCPAIADPDWFHDPVTGRRAPAEPYAFSIDHRDEAVTGNVKAVWEISRHHHLTVLASAYWLTGDGRYAETVAAQLRSWWSANPYLSGIHWTSGIEVGVRLISWVWIRRLLDSWEGAGDLFEHNPQALHQIRWHQEYLEAFRSHGSSANNHVIAEEVGRLVAACAFAWFDESERWRDDARAGLDRELAANTFDSGINRELATDYHRFVTELGLLALVEADVAAAPLGDGTRRLLAASLDAAAAVVDVTGAPPRQGDGDEGRGLVLDDPASDPWGAMLGWGAAVLGARPWWPAVRPGVAAAALGALAVSRVVPDRPERRPDVFDDAGIVVLRTDPAEGPEIWCRCDGGPHGFLAIAAHGHADALAVEVRHDGVEVLVDPGTYCYHGEPQWRSYFRGTSAHNTVLVDGANQSVEAGPFMWAAQAETTTTEVDLGGRTQRWSARHTGYARHDGSVIHQRTVTLDHDRRELVVADTVRTGETHEVRVSFHLGPQVDVALEPTYAVLRWRGPDGEVTAEAALPAELAWSAHRGETDPALGWYSPRFGERVPTTTLIGRGSVSSATTFTTRFAFPNTFWSIPAGEESAEIPSMRRASTGRSDG